MAPHRVALLAVLAAAIALAGCTNPDGPGATSDGGTATTPATSGGAGDGATTTPTSAGFPIALQEVAVTPTSADLGDIVTARAVLKNVGAAGATAHVEFRLGTEVASKALATLAPGESTVVAGPVRAGRTGTLSIEARVVESGETKTASVLVHGPDLVDAKVSVVDLQQCDRVAHRVSFRNAGDGAAIGVTVEAQLRSTDGAVVDRITQAVEDVKPGASTLVEFTHVAPARCPTTHTYTVHVVVTAQAGVKMEYDSAPFTV